MQLSVGALVGDMLCALFVGSTFGQGGGQRRAAFFKRRLLWLFGLSSETA